MRWIPFLLCAAFLGAGCLVLDAAAGPEIPQLLLLLALVSGETTADDGVLPRWWVAGLVRDVVVGPQLGLSAVAFLAFGRIDLATHGRLQRERFAVRLLLAVVFAGGIRLVDAIAADPTGAWHRPVETLRSAAAVAGWSAMALPVLAFLLKPLQRPPRIRPAPGLATGR